MPIIPKLECRVETFREDDAVFMRIGIHQEEMLLAYYAFDTLLTGFADKIALHDCIEQPYYVSWLHDDLTAATKAGEMDLAVYVVGKTEQ